MNRRDTITGALALFAASSLPSVALPGAMPSVAILPSQEAAEFARIVIELPAHYKGLLVDKIRAIAPDSEHAIGLADAIERIAMRDGWVRGEEHEALMRLFDGA